MANGFFSLADVIKNEPAFGKLRNMIKENDVISEFNSIFPSLKKIALPVKIEKKVLFLKVENAAWRNELKFKERIIIDKINKYFSQSEKEDIVRKIKFIL